MAWLHLSCTQSHHPPVNFVRLMTSWEFGPDAKKEKKRRVRYTQGNGESISAYCIVILNTCRRDFISCQWDLFPQTNVCQQQHLRVRTVVGINARPSKERKGQNQTIGVKIWMDSLARCLRRVYATHKFRSVERVWNGLTHLTFQGIAKVFLIWIAYVTCAWCAVPTSLLIVFGMGFTAEHRFWVWIISEASEKMYRNFSYVAA
jgi:hypothetical protein